jgi:hypothetical protein
VLRGNDRMELDHPLGRVVAPDYTEPLSGNLNQAFADDIDGGVLRFRYETVQLARRVIQRIRPAAPTVPAPSFRGQTIAQPRELLAGSFTACRPPKPLR